MRSRFLSQLLKKGSFADAAKYLGTNPSAVSKAVERLEKSIHVRLFHRTTRSVRLTLSGERYLVTAENSLDELRACESELAEEIDHPNGVLRINLPATYGRLYIRPLLNGFCKLYPDIKIEMRFDDTFVDSIAQGFDLSIRTGPIKDSGFVTQQLSSMDIVTCASPQLADQLHRPFTPQYFGKMPWLRYKFKQTGKVLPIQTLENGELNYYDPNQFIVTDDGEVIADLCIDGLGLVQMPQFVLRHG